MLQHVHSVMIGSSVPASYTAVTALTEGQIALFDENRALITDANGAIAASAIYVGVAGAKMNVTKTDGSIDNTQPLIKFSNRIDKNSRPSMVSGEYVAPTQEKVVITATNATIVAGNRYVIRIYYKDLYEDKSQFTHTYEVYAESSTPADLISALAAKINAHKGRRVQASTSAAVLTLTALEKDDNESAYSINEYSVVNMEVSLYETIPGALLSNQPNAVPGVTIVKTAAEPGKGYWKQVRDAERRNMGYNGKVYEDAYPEIMPLRKVVPGTEYDYIIIENDNLYLSNDNQYIKTTPLTTEIYCPSLKDSTLDKLIQSFIAGEDKTA